MSKWSQMRRHCSAPLTDPQAACPMVLLVALTENGFGHPVTTWTSSFSPASWTVRVYQGTIAPGNLVDSTVGLSGSGRTDVPSYVLTGGLTYQTTVEAHLADGTVCAARASNSLVA